MKIAIWMAGLALVSGITAAEMDHATPRATHPAFERLRALEGEWVGKAFHTEGGQQTSEDTRVIYQIIGAGSTVMETLFPGTPHQMVTMYHMDGVDLILTHYCAAGNQPTLLAAPMSDGKTLSFEFQRGTNMKPSDTHMHSVIFTFADDDHLKSVWTSQTSGKPGDRAVFELARKK